MEAQFAIRLTDGTIIDRTGSCWSGVPAKFRTRTAARDFFFPFKSETAARAYLRTARKWGDDFPAWFRGAAIVGVLEARASNATATNPKTGETTMPKKLPPDPENMNDDRASWAEVALQAFMDETGTDPEDAISDLIADLKHLCDRKGDVYGDADAMIARGQRCYEEEILPE
jgi:hypothetical protein